jgi:DNA repair exonuclease SbcCD ATPase subunit
MVVFARPAMEALTMGSRSKPWQRIESDLREWAEELEKACAKAEREAAAVRADYYDRLRELHDDIQKAVEKWKTLAVDVTSPEDEQASSSLRDLKAAVERELKRWEPTLRASAEKAESEAKRLGKEFKVRRQQARERLGALRRSAGDSWGDLKPAIERAWAELRPALQTAASRFRQPTRD